MLYGPNGSVVQSSRTSVPRADRQEAQEEEIRAKLKGMDELLDIQYVPWAGRYALVCKWPQSDGRWKMYVSGEIGAPYDTLGWFCEDMQDANSLPVSVDSIENKVLDLLASCDNVTHPWKGRMRDIIAKNAKLRKSRTDMIAEQAEDIAKTLWQAAGRHDAHKLEKIMEEVSKGQQ